jgi:hypothetical protein
MDSIATDIVREARGQRCVRVCLVCVMRRRAEPRIAGLWLGVPRSRSQCKKSPAEARLEVRYAKAGNAHPAKHPIRPNPMRRRPGTRHWEALRRAISTRELPGRSRQGRGWRPNDGPRGAFRSPRAIARVCRGIAAPRVMKFHHPERCQRLGQTTVARRRRQGPEGGRTFSKPLLPRRAR